MRAVPTQRTFRNWLSPGAPWDQGPTPHCVAYAGLALLTAHPISNVQMHAETLYKLCQKNDQWPGENYEGTSVLGLMRVLSHFGMVKEYRWAFNAGPVISHVLERSPVVVGTDWRELMFTPDRWGYISPQGPSYGGHAYLIVGVNTRRANPDGTTGAFRLLNSWGAWGDGRGRAWISIADLDALIRNRGEAAAATEVRR